jgi:hypothetical protein
MPIDPSMLAKSIGTLTDLHPDQDLPATLQQAVLAAKSLFDADAARGHAGRPGRQPALGQRV